VSPARERYASEALELTRETLHRVEERLEDSGMSVDGVELKGDFPDGEIVVSCDCSGEHRECHYAVWGPLSEFGEEKPRSLALEIAAQVVELAASYAPATSSNSSSTTEGPAATKPCGSPGRSRTTPPASSTSKRPAAQSQGFRPRS
jgi:hypothetical protein